MMNTRLAILALTVLASVTRLLGAPQMDLLTIKEAARLIDTVPEIVQMRKSGLCPSYTPSFDLPEQLSIGVRVGCGPNAGQLSGNFRVDRSTGIVTGDVDGNISLLNRVGQSLAQQIVAEARKRLLSPAEALCLARKAAEALAGCGGRETVMEAKSFGPTSRLESTSRFMITCRHPSVPFETGALLAVDLARAAVREDGDGKMLMSRELGDLTAKIIQLRVGAALSTEDIADIARRMPSIQHELLSHNTDERCVLLVEDWQLNDELTAVVVCAGRTPPGMKINVNIQTATVRAEAVVDKRDLEAASKLAAERLKAAQTRARDLRKLVQGSCP